MAETENERKPPIQNFPGNGRNSIIVLRENDRKIIQLAGGSAGTTPSADCPDNFTDSGYPCSIDCEERCVYGGTCSGPYDDDRCIPTLVRDCTTGVGLCWYINSAAFCMGPELSKVCYCSYSWIYDNCRPVR